MKKAVDGLILRALDVGESDKLLTILTADEGRISVMAKGARSMRSKVMSLCHPLNYVNLEYYEKNDRRWLSGGSVNDSFFGLSSDLEGSALASYLLEVATEITDEGVAASEILRMTLNSLYGIQQRQKPIVQIKAVYEWFAASVSGFEPDLGGCAFCGKESADTVWLDVMNGRLICEDCLKKRSGLREADLVDEYCVRNILLPLHPAALRSIRYVLSAPPERILAFRIQDGRAMEDFARSGEVYLLNHLERSFDSLDFYRLVTKD